VLKSSVRHADGEPSRPCEKFDATHREIPLFLS
jgi:hypothetical protein